MDESLVSKSCINFDGRIEENGIIHSNRVLHPYTNSSTETFCYRLVQLFRQSKLAKIEHRKFLDLIESVLPIPNELPKNMNELLSLLEMKENFFRKRRICLVCSRDIPDSLCFCFVRFYITVCFLYYCMFSIFEKSQDSYLNVNKS